MSTQMWAAIISASGAILVALIAGGVNLCRLKQEMSNQHRANSTETVAHAATLGTKIDMMHDDVRDISARLDVHLTNHVPTLDAIVLSHHRSTSSSTVTHDQNSNNAA